MSLEQCASVILLGRLLAASVLLAMTPIEALAASPGYTFKVVAYIGDAAPGGGAFVNDFEPGRLNNHGQLAFTAEPELPFQEAIFLAGGGTLQQIMRFGQSAPGGGLFSTSELGVIGLNDAGDLAFSFTLEPFNFGPPVYGGTYRWSHQTQTLSPIVIPGVTPVPGLPGSVFTGVDFDVQLNNLGRVVFNGFLNTPAGPATGIFQQDKSGHLTSLVLPGDPAPGGGTFDFVHDTGLNDGGDVAFEGAAGGGNPQIYLWRFGTGQVEALPLPPGTVVALTPLINNRGDVAFQAFGDTAAGLFLRSRGSTIPVALVGAPAPGGGNFLFISQLFSGEQLSLNNVGDVAFDAATDTGDEAMYLFSQATGTLRRVFGIGTVIPGVGTIANLEELGFFAPLSNANLNDRGQISFVAMVSDGSTSRGALLIATPAP